MILHSDREGNDCIRKLRCHCIQIMHSDINSAKTSMAPRIQAIPTITAGKGFQNTSKTSIKKPSITPNPPQAAPEGRIVNRF